VRERIGPVKAMGGVIGLVASHASRSCCLPGDFVSGDRFGIGGVDGKKWLDWLTYLAISYTAVRKRRSGK
jgi:hypothetical protein